MADRGMAGAQPGLREVVLVAAAVVGVVLGLALLTGLLPAEIQRIVYETPVAITVLFVGTGWLLWRISRRTPGPPSG